MFGKSNFLDLESSTMITDDRVQKYSSMFGLSWANLSMNSQCYIKNVCSDMA